MLLSPLFFTMGNARSASHKDKQSRLKASKLRNKLEAVAIEVMGREDAPRFARNTPHLDIAIQCYDRDVPVGLSLTARRSRFNEFFKVWELRCEYAMESLLSSRGFAARTFESIAAWDEARREYASELGLGRIADEDQSREHAASRRRRTIHGEAWLRAGLVARETGCTQREAWEQIKSGNLPGPSDALSSVLTSAMRSVRHD